jgi:hypothetical protein
MVLDQSVPTNRSTMRLSRYFLPLLKEAPAEAKSPRIG